MPKPLLTDEMIQQAAREKECLEREIAQARQDDTQLIKKFAPQKPKWKKIWFIKAVVLKLKREERGKKSRNIS
jgi:hypothetical protein